jgi:proteic killer suppression protein
MNQAKKIRRRLDDLRAAPTLETLRPPGFPGRCHELKGKRKGQLSLDLEHPYRLVFEPATNPAPTLADGGLDWAKVAAVRIIGIADTHDE